MQMPDFFVPHMVHRAVLFDTVATLGACGAPVLGALARH
jgi:hypothetical protein